MNAITEPTNEARDREERLVTWVKEFVPHIRAARQEIVDHSRVPQHVADAFEKAGVYKMMIPREYGGLEAKVDTWRRVVTEIGKGDAGVAWSVSLNTMCAYVAAGFYPKKVVDEVFANPNVRMAGVFSPRGAQGRKVDGGIVIEKGIWFFCSGVPQADYVLLGVPTFDEQVSEASVDGQIRGMGVALVPMSDITVLNDWDASGLRGSGSSNVTMENVFIPWERIADLGACTLGTQARTFPDKKLYLTAFAPLSVAILAYPVLGAGMHYLEQFLAGLPKRDIKLTPYDKQGEAPVTHIQLGVATAKLDAANEIMIRAAREMDTWAENGEYMPLLDRARIVRDTSASNQLVWEAIDLLASASGGSFARRDNALNGIWQDIKVATQHPFVTVTSNFESYGRLICGVEPALMPI